ncbi:MAG: hypothetical protein ACYC5Y_03170 [Symbiobacteriia bacterium]
MSVSIDESRSRRDFKEMLGQANHFLVTILVGLHTVSMGKADVPQEHRAAWNPRSPQESAKRAKSFVQSTSFAWAVDALDTYVSQALKKPSIIETLSLRNDLYAAGQLVSKKLAALRGGLPNTARVEGALVELGIVWRNRLVHSLADNEVRLELERELEAAGAEIAAEHRGLDVSRMIASVKKSAAPTFKETATVIAACHRFVQAVDQTLLATVNQDRYFREVLQEHFAGSGSAVEARKGLALLWRKTRDRRKNSIVQILQNDAALIVGPQGQVDPEAAIWIESLCDKSYAEAKAFLWSEDGA